MRSMGAQHMPYESSESSNCGWRPHGGFYIWYLKPLQSFLYSVSLCKPHE